MNSLFAARCTAGTDWLCRVVGVVVVAEQTSGVAVVRASHLYSIKVSFCQQFERGCFIWQHHMPCTFAWLVAAAAMGALLLTHSEPVEDLPEVSSVPVYKYLAGLTRPLPAASTQRTTPRQLRVVGT